MAPYYCFSMRINLHDINMLSTDKLKYNMNIQNQVNIQGPSEGPPLINVRKLIDKPKDLIDKTSFNKIYPQEWINKNIIPPSCSVLAKRHQSRKSSAQCENNPIKCSTQLQYRNTSKPSTKARNTKFSKNKTLIEVEESGDLGNIIYSRVAFKNNWNWKFKQLTQTSLTTQQQQQFYETEQCLVRFDSRFESGNLWKAYKTMSTTVNSIQTYYLMTQNDTNTMGYNQWFYFRASCKKPYETIRFQIINMRKSSSCFSKGMKIAIFNQNQWEESKNSWHRAGVNIQYSCNQIKITKQSFQAYYTLGWDYTFQSSNKWVYFAYSYPYTYTDLKNTISIIKQRKFLDFQAGQLCLTPLKNEIFHIKIGRPFHNQDEEVYFEGKFRNRYAKIRQQNLESNQTNDLHKISITTNQENLKDQLNLKYLNLSKNIGQPYYLSTFQPSFLKQKVRVNIKKRENKCKSFIKQEKKLKKDILFIMCRAHPGQTPSSFVMQGIIQALLYKNMGEAKYLKDKFWIHIIPMLNPDGVIHGNTRTSFTGSDLNRRWLKPHYVLHPQLVKIKQHIRNLVENDHKIFAMIDCHGHTKKQSNFLYGCCDKNNYHNHAQVKLLNYLFGKADTNFNNLFSSHFVGESKKSTARITFYRQFKCFSYTLQSSFMGPNDSSLHFSIMDYFNIGKNLVKSVAYFHTAIVSKTLAPQKKLFSSLLSNGSLKQAVIDYYDRHRRNNSFSETQPQIDKDSAGSSSCPSQCNYDEKFLLQNIFQPYDYKKQSPSRYKKNRSRVKVGKRNLSLSISDKPRMSILGLVNKDKMSSTKGVSMKSKIQIFSNKLPNLNAQTKEQEEHSSQFHAFNFKSKKNASATRKKKQQLDMEITIE